MDFEKHRDLLIQEISNSINSIVINLNTLNRSLNNSIQVGKEFDNVSNLWENFYNGLNQQGEKDEEKDKEQDRGEKEQDKEEQNRELEHREQDRELEQTDQNKDQTEKSLNHPEILGSPRSDEI